MFQKKIHNDNSGPGFGLPAETIENDAVFDRFGAVFDRFGAAERFRNFAERFRNRSAKFRNRSAQSLSETQRKMSSRFLIIPKAFKGRRRRDGPISRAPALGN